MTLFPRPYLELKPVIVNLKSGTALRGLLLKRTGGFIIIREATLLQSLGQPMGPKPAIVDGEVLVREADIDFIQVVGTWQ